MHIILLMKSKADEYTKSEKNVYEKIKDNIDDVSRLSATTFASKHHISQASITRFAKKLGFGGYNDLKYEITRELYNESETDLPPHKMYANVIEELEYTLSQQDIEQLRKVIVTARNIYITGIQRNKIPSLLMDYNLKEFGYSCQVLDYDNLARITSFSSSEDILIVFSYTGNKNTYAALLENYLLNDDNSPKLILVTGNSSATMASFAYKTYTIPKVSNISSVQIIFCIFIDMLFYSLPVKSKTFISKQQNNQK